MKHLVMFALVSALDLVQAANQDPRLPRADQVDKPENIKFIVPDKSKLAGTVLWGWYANKVQQQTSTAACALQPHTLMAAALLLLAACCAVFGYTRSPDLLQLMFNVSGFMYGVSDSGANLMIT